MNPYEMQIASALASHLAPLAAAAAARQIVAIPAPTAANIAAEIERHGVSPGTAAMLAGQVMNLPVPGAASPPAGPVAAPPVPVLGGPGAFALPATWAGPLPTVGLLPGAGTPPVGPAVVPPAPTTTTSWWKWLVGALLALIVLALLGLGVWRTWSATDRLSAIAVDTHAVAATLPGVAADARRAADAAELSAISADNIATAMPDVVDGVRRTAMATEASASELKAAAAAADRRHQQVLAAIRANHRRPIEVKISGGAAPAAH